MDILSGCSSPKCIEQWQRPTYLQKIDLLGTSQQLGDKALDYGQKSTPKYEEVSSLDNLVDSPLDPTYCVMLDADPISGLLQR
jgi:hypothetical protein